MGWSRQQHEKINPPIVFPYAFLLCCVWLYHSLDQTDFILQGQLKLTVRERLNHNGLAFLKNEAGEE